MSRAPSTRARCSWPRPVPAPVNRSPYLVPGGALGAENGCRVLVATRTRNLQDQLLSKELPLVNRLIGRKAAVQHAQGPGKLPLPEPVRTAAPRRGRQSFHSRAFRLLPLIPWVESTLTGDIEEQNQFNPKWFGKVWDLIRPKAGDARDAAVGFFKTCFLQRARQNAAGSHLVVINHALFYAEMGMANPFLGPIDSIIFDEAHHLESGGHRCLRVELDTNRISLFLEELNNLVQSMVDLKGSMGIAACGKDLKSQLKRVRKYSQSLLESVQEWAKAHRGEDGGRAEYQIPVHEGDWSANVEAPAFNTSLECCATCSTS